MLNVEEADEATAIVKVIMCLFFLQGRARRTIKEPNKFLIRHRRN